MARGSRISARAHPAEKTAIIYDTRIEERDRKAIKKETIESNLGEKKTFSAARELSGGGEVEGYPLFETVTGAMIIAKL